jgi:hypothetical protein
MESIDLGTPLKETIEGLRKYIDQLIGYNKLVFAKKVGELSSYLTLLITLGFLATLVLIFLSFSFVWWYASNNPDDMHIGYLIVSGFYTFVAIIIYVFREILIFKPIRKSLGNIVFSDVHKNKKNEVFESSEMLDAKIKNAREGLNHQEKELNDLVEVLGEKYTFKNIGKQALQSIYGSFITTSNITKLAFSLVQKFQSRRNKKKNKTTRPKLKDGKNSE